MGGVLGLLLIAAIAFTGGKRMKVESPVFQEGDPIPKRYTCDGLDISPPIRWSNFPEGTKSFVLIMDDPDAPIGTFTHWIIYDIPPQVSELDEGIPKVEEISLVKQGINDFGYVGYGGPCPPKGHGHHRYYFRVYALDIESLGLSPRATRKQVEERMRGHILAEGSVMGRYRRE